MTDWNAASERGLVRTLVLWIGAALAVMGIHAAALAWILQENPPEPLGLMETAFLIELSPEIGNGQNDTPPSALEQTSDDSAPSEPEPEEQQPEEEPVAQEEPPVEEPPEVVENAPKPEEVLEPREVAVPLPLPPKKPVVRTVERKVEPEKKPVKRVADAPPPKQTESFSSSSVVPSGGGRAASSAEAFKWTARLMAHLERKKRYPSKSKARKEQGTVHVRFSIDGKGNVLAVSLAKTSGYGDLDNEVLALVRRASPLPTPPTGEGQTIMVSVKFALK